MLLDQVHARSPKDNHGKGLVRPTEIAPYDAVVQEAHDKADAKKRDTEQQALPPVILVKADLVRKCEACRAESGVA